MDKPTLQDVKEYFKNAKEVKNLFDGRAVNFTEVVYGYCPDTYMNKKGGTTLWCNERGYAEIISYKEPLYQLTAKEVVHAYENPQYLKDTFKECFETELEVGKWYKNPNRKAIMYFETIKNNTCFGYGFDNSGIWENKLEYFCNNWEPATEKEVEEALVKEAIKRGLVEGAKVNPIKGVYGINTDKEYKLIQNRLYFCGDCFFKDGIWAEIIQVPTYTIPEAESKFNIKIKAV